VYRFCSVTAPLHICLSKLRRPSCHGYQIQSAHRVAMAVFWRIFHHDGKISPACWEWGCTLTPFHSIYNYEQSCGVRFSWEGTIHSPISHLPLYVLCGTPPPTTKKVKDDVQSNNEMHQTACFFTLCSYESGTSLMHKEGDTRITW
jgi:hypothetical protein